MCSYASGLMCALQLSKAAFNDLEPYRTINSYTERYLISMMVGVLLSLIIPSWTHPNLRLVVMIHYYASVTFLVITAVHQLCILFKNSYATWSQVGDGSFKVKAKEE